MGIYQAITTAAATFFTELSMQDKPKKTFDLSSGGQPFVFSFGDPEPILDNHLIDFGSTLSLSGDYYKPPVSFDGLGKLMGANPYHGPILHFKKNMVAKWYQPNSILSFYELRDAALDYNVLANCYFQQHVNGFGKLVRLSRLPGAMMRKKKNGNYIQLLNYQQQLEYGRLYIEFQPGEVLHIKETDLRQDIYGIPQYLGGIQSVLLSESATLFRRKYYVNGAHLGYILVTNDANINEDTAKQLEKKIKEGKGAGNFRSIYMNIPRSSARDPVKVIPIGEIGTKDEFQAIKEVTEMEMCAMHRVYPSLAAIIPANVGGFGDVQKTLEVYHDVEVMPLQQALLQINALVGRQVVQFVEPEWKGK